MKYAFALIVVGYLAYLTHRLYALEIEVHFGTYPSDMFPDDPRHNKGD